ncbi:MAG: hypothetical protein COY19_11480 [Candidatus Marinimicrobia bacterium CG_4_10_14_0_2_um_filter_48_9]|nr:MAG: hypothetical protein COY19_11480 [Candidatus Marinimicrobia bacterium CG_4_10_14_0_2_um_filter_48_9]
MSIVKIKPSPRKLFALVLRLQKMRLFILALFVLPVWLLAGTVVPYGEDPFIQGMSLQAFSLGQIRALPMETVSIGGNVASLAGRDLSLTAQHTEAYGGIYQTDVVQLTKSAWSLVIFRGGVSGIADTRGALNDLGADGLPNTNDDGEGNGLFDPGESLNISAISFFNVQQWVAEAGYSKRISTKLSTSAQIRLLYHDLHTQSGFGIGFHAGLLYNPWRSLQLGIQATNLLTTTVFWSSGTQEHYLPGIYGAAMYEFNLSDDALLISPVVQLEYQAKPTAELSGDGYWGAAFGAEVNFRHQLKLRMGESSDGQFTVGAGIVTHYFNLDYATAFSDLSKAAGQSHRVGIQVHLAQFNYWR